MRVHTAVVAALLWLHSGLGTGPAASAGKAVIGPASELDKEYVVRVAGRIDEPTLARLLHGLELDGRKLRPAGVEVIFGQTLRFILNEGRNRQIRRMCELVGLRVMDLLRVRIGTLKLGDLPEGGWRILTPAERDALIAASKTPAKTPGVPPPRS